MARRVLTLARVWIGVGCALAALVALLAQLGALPWYRSIPIDPDAIEGDHGKAFRIRIDLADPDSTAGVASRVRLFENDVRLGPAHAGHEEIRRLGAGRFSHWGTHIYFSSSDGSDPRTNGRHYVVGEPRAVPGEVWLAIAAVAFLANAALVGRLLARLRGVNPAWVGLGIGLVAVAFRVVVGVHHAGDSFSHIIKGVPISDARRWAVMAEDFSRGQRWDPTWGMWWDGVRPLYWIFLGSLFAFTGPSLVAAWLANVVFGAAAAVLMFDIVRRLSNWALGAVAGLALAVDFENARFALSVTTEPLGNFLALLALDFLVLGTTAAMRPAEAPGARRSVSAAFFGGGVALALSNLARPLSLAAAATLPLAFALVLRRKPIALGFRRLAQLTLLFLGGVAVIIGPWMVRQYVKHGVLTISANSAEMAYAAVTRQYGVWTPAVGALGDRFATIKERVDFYNRETMRNLGRDPGFFVARSARDLVRVAAGSSPERWPLQLTCAVWLAVALARDRRSAAVPFVAAVAMAACIGLSPGAVVASLWVAATLLACLTRDPMAVPGVLMGTTVLTMAMISVPYDTRIYLQCQAYALLLSVWFCWRVLDLADRLASDAEAPSPAPREGPIAWGRPGKIVATVAAAAVALLLAGTIKALIAHADPAPPPAVLIPPDDAAPWIRAAIERAPEYARAETLLQVRRARLRPGYRISFAPWERLDHWNPLFSTARPYAFTVFETRPCIFGFQQRFTDTAPALPKVYAVYPDGLVGLDGDDLMFVGVPVVRDREGSSFEVVAIGREAAGPDPSRLVMAPPAARALHARMLAPPPPRPSP